MVKRPLRKVLRTAAPSFRELSSILAEIELCINLRPLLEQTNGSSEPRAICPADLLFGYHGRTLFPQSSGIRDIPNQASAIVLSKLWRKQQLILDSFWREFKRGYLQQLRSNHLSQPVQERDLKEGDVCILADSHPSRGYWQLCRVLSVYGGRRTDQRQRSIQMGSGKTLRRPISVLYPLNLAE